MRVVRRVPFSHVDFHSLHFCSLHSRTTFPVVPERQMVMSNRSGYDWLNVTYAVPLLTRTSSYSQSCHVYKRWKRHY
jgi:hypothetical protein